MRDYWNNVSADEDKTEKEVIDIIKKAQPLTYYQIQELRNSSELCDRGHFETIVKVIADQVGAKVPKDLAAIMEDPDFDVRITFMKKVVDAVDPAPVASRAKK